MVRHVKLPEKLYLSPPQSPTTPTSYSSVKSSTYTASVELLNETSSTALAVSDRIPGFKTSAGGCVHPSSHTTNLSVYHQFCFLPRCVLLTERATDVVYLCSISQFTPCQPQ